MTGRLALLLLAVGAGALPAQALPERAPVATLSWGNGAFTMYAKAGTVELSVWPTALVRQRKLADGDFSFSLPRDSIHSWIGDVRFIVGEKRPGPTASLADWGAVIRGPRRGALLMAGQDPRAPSTEPPFYLLVRASTEDSPITFRVQKPQLLRLLDVLDSLADAPPADFRWDLTLPIESMADTTVPNTPVEAVKFGQLKMPSGRSSPGEVVLFYVVDSAGRVEPARIRVVYSDGDDLTRSAVAAIRTSQFRPATLRGSAVPQLVRQRISFFFRDRDD